jgi:serine/threonine-protein kinase
MEAAKYRILHELGAGGMGTVCKGQVIGEAGFRRPVVIKKLRTPDPEHLRLFVEEARRYALLDHENIGRIFDFERIAGEPCIILEFIDGWTLVEYLERHQKLGYLGDVGLSVFIASRVCRALQYVFEKARIVHRDVSPSNIMMTTEGTVKLIDFGIAARSGKRESYMAGKPAYLSPEMALDLRADNKSDIFSLGTVLFEMLSGERLFPGEQTEAVLRSVVSAPIPAVRSLNPEVPEAVEAILSRALERDPARRFATAAAMGEACEHFLYDKGYGPTNLTLKHYLRSLFDRTGSEDEDASGLEPTLIPVADEMASLPADPKKEPARVAPPLARVVSSVDAPRPEPRRGPGPDRS